MRSVSSPSRAAPVCPRAAAGGPAGQAPRARASKATASRHGGRLIKDLANGFLLGANPFRIEALWSEMYAHTFWAKGGGPIVFAGISAIEQALWDINPVDPFDVEALKKVSEHVHLPIAVGERLYTRYGFRRVLELHAADVLQPDVTNTGGILETKKIAAMAETYNARIAPHNCAGPVSTAAAVEIGACTPTC